MFIYGLIDPRTLLIRYIGLATSKRRPHQHRYCTDDTYKSRWIRSLHVEGLDYEICILETCFSTEELKNAERWWIAYGRASDWPLTNLTDGGESSAGLKQSAEFCAALSKRMIGNDYAAGGRGGVFTNEARRRAKLAQLGPTSRSDAAGRK